MVTLARSVAHLSSEMRTQHVIVQVRINFVMKIRNDQYYVDCEYGDKVLVLVIVRWELSMS